MLIEVYTSIAEQERNTILQRQREGIEAAKSQGKHLGRPIIEYPPDWSHLYKLWIKGIITSKEFMIKVDMKKATFYTKVRKYKEQQKNRSLNTGIERSIVWLIVKHVVYYH
ncbi:hypothetical protein AB0Y38_18210 [Lysinibacillus capsici]